MTQKLMAYDRKYHLISAAIALLCAALGVGVFLLAFSLLPQSDAPAWLPAIVGVSAALLAAYFRYTDRAFRRKKTLECWGVKLVAFVCIALLTTVTLELWGGNHRAFVTRECEPEDMDLSGFMDFHGNYYEPDENGAITFENGDEPAHFYVMSEELSEKTLAFQFSLEGARQEIRYSVSLKDDASVYEYVDAYSGYCAPDASEQALVSGALYSNGTMYGLSLKFTLTPNAVVTLTNLTLNPQVSVVFNPLRMALLFGASLLTLCAFRFPWQEVEYTPNRASHRLVILLPMILLLVTSYFLSYFCIDAEPTTGKRASPIAAIPLDEVPIYTDMHGSLFKSFLQGKLYIDIEPSEELLSLDNPYDRSAIQKHNAPYMFDLALYNGKYYLYFGTAPILLVYYPCYWLTGLVPTYQTCAFVLSFFGICLTYLATNGLLRRYGKCGNLFLQSLLCFTVTCVSGFFVFLTSAGRYTSVVASNVAMMAGAIGFGLLACDAQKKWQRAVSFVLAGLCFAMQCESRANTILITIVFLAPVFIGVLADKRAKLSSKLCDSVCFLVPALIGVGFVLWYNAARFGSIMEFGQTHQITLEDIHYNSFRPEYIPLAIWHFLFDQPIYTAGFPFVQYQDTVINTTGNFFYCEWNMGILAIPLLWALPFAPCGCLLCREDERSLRIQRTVTFLGTTVMMLALMVVTHFYAGLNARYSYDFFFPAAMLSALAITLLFRNIAIKPEGRELTVCRCCLQIVVIALCVFSCFLCLMLAFGGSNKNIMHNSPEVYYWIANSFFPY